MRYEITFEDLIKEFKKYSRTKLIRLVLNHGFDPSQNEHTIESFLRKEGIPYYFKGDGIEQERDYEIDLTALKIIYP